MLSYIPISIGSGCQVAHQLKEHGLKSATLPFDWISTPYFASVLELFETGFADLMKIEDMGFREVAEKPVTANLRLNIFFPHDFEVGKFNEQLSTIQQRYFRRIQRLKWLLDDTKPLLFIRITGDSELSLFPGDTELIREANRELAFKFIGLIERLYPRLDFKFTLLTFKGDFKMIHKEGKLEHYDLPSSGTWEGDRAAWSQLLAKYSLMPLPIITPRIKCL